jgi:hypothetical protein
MHHRVRSEVNPSRGPAVVESCLCISFDVMLRVSLSGRLRRKVLDGKRGINM